jgi:tetratricopeptide (TPR) repeat protein
MVCLFLCPAFIATGTIELQWEFDEHTESAYKLALNLEFEEVHRLIPSPASPQQHYVVSLAEALELLINEDAEKFSMFEERFNERLERKTKLNSPDDLLLQAEIRTQWAFVYLKFGHEFDAALNFRQAYLTVQSLKDRFPKFQAVNKTSGLLNVVIGSIPQKYNWVLSLLNIQGSATAGIDELKLVKGPFAFEGRMIHALINGFLLQKPSVGIQEIKEVLTFQPTNRLALFLGSALARKNRQSDSALAMLDSLDKQARGEPLQLAYALRGELYLYKGEYLNAISSYRWFIGNYRGQNGIKDAYYKIGLCYWLNGNSNDAQSTFKLARTMGKDASEADKYAARSLAENELPHVTLTKARYATDGGYYERAWMLLDSIQPSDIPTIRDQVEYFYRKARLAHYTDDVLNAKKLYMKSIEISGDQPWYFAPNACLQLGYIALNEGRESEAKSYFNRALSYGKHEYKNSIDSKAKSALAQMKRK